MNEEKARHFPLVAAAGVRLVLEIAAIPLLLGAMWIGASHARTSSPACEEPRTWPKNLYLSSPLIDYLRDRNLGGAISWLRKEKSSLDAVDAEGVAPLLVAVNLGDVRAAEYLISHGADVNRPHPVLGTPLILAMSQANLEMAEMLLRRGVDPSAICGRGDTPLCAAVRGGDVQGVRLILARHVDPMPRGVFENPLDNACVSDDYADIVRALLDVGVDPNRPGRNGELPLVTASTYGSARCVALLLAAGADPNQPDAKGRTAASPRVFESR